MKIHLKAVIVFIIAAFIAATYNDVYAKRGSDMDVVLVIDSSGSMKKTDPQALRIPAAKLFISLLNENDRAGIISFSDKGYPIIPLTPVDSRENRDSLVNAAEKISSDGLYTNLNDALSKGLSMLTDKRTPERNRFIILMSDGMMDVGNPDEDIRLVSNMKDELAAKLEEEEVKVYTIAFTEQSDTKLLEKISKQTGGFYNLALTDKDFHLIFTSIFESLKGPDMLPVSENGFLIDGSIEEVTIVVTKSSPGTRIKLHAPDGNGYSNKDRSTGIGWFASDNFDMITVQRPAEGKWEILFSAGENNKAYIITNLKLQTNFDQLYSTFGDPLDIRIWLEKDGVTITEQAVLDKVDIYLEMTGPDGNVSELKPFSKGEGIFVRSVAPFTPGNYKLRIVARGNTFEREKAFVFNVADAKESKADILAKQQKEKKGNAPDIQKNEEDNTDKLSWSKIIIQFISVNLVLGLIVLAYFKRDLIKGLVKKKKELPRKDDKVEDQPEEDVIEKQEEPQVLENQDVQTGQEEEIKQKPQELKQEAAPEKEAEETIAEDAEQITEGEEENPETELQEEVEKPESPAIGEAPDIAEQEQPSADENNNEPAAEGGPQEVNKEDTAQILNQDDLDQLLASAKMPPDNAEEESAAKDEDVQTDNIDAMWEDALTSQREAEAGEKDPPDKEDAATALDREIERLEQEKQKADETGNKNDQQEDIDDIWQEALKEQKTAEGEGSAGDKRGVDA